MHVDKMVPWILFLSCNQSRQAGGSSVCQDVMRSYGPDSSFSPGLVAVCLKCSQEGDLLAAVVMVAAPPSISMDGFAF